ncbi:TonB-dependent receptor [Sediminibacterium sp.]|uniref:TonB-dependent receptor n=1 Tax=Sediminibacterium sp. TaxID=1917865 RepID=UPI0025FBBAA8|nr:TonB-dependent receptor [Sediminibacterium sp.]MBW0179042.1 outer membrane beta-barrel protein [Sediminibacterium sp.]
MLKYIATLLIIVLLPAFVKAQNTGTVKGHVFDTATNRGLAYATVSVVNSKDSTLITFTRADSTGKFSIRSLDKGSYLISASYVGYVPVWKSIDVKAGQELDLGQLILTDVLKSGEVTVTARRAPVTINGDTVEFNTENFKTQPNAVVEDLLKRLPGVTVDNDGTIRVNGQRVNRVLVNGKEFFTGDPKIATKNLDADAVDKVQVFDKKSDRSEFTGIDDGNSEKAINLKLKKDRNKSTFGRIAGGAGGDDGRYDAQTNINRFNGDQQLSLLGMANNVNKQGFSLTDIMNFSGDLARGMRNSGGGVSISIGGGGGDNGLPVTGLGQNQQGVATTYAGGVNYNDLWNKKSNVNTSGMFSDIDLLTNRITNRQNLLPGNTFDYISNSNSARKVQQQRWNGSIDHKFDTMISLKVTPQVSAQQNNTNTYSSYSSTNKNGLKINDGFSDSKTQSDALNLSATALYRQRLKKKGRTISGNFTLNYNDSKQTGDLYTRNTFYAAGVALRDSITNQKNTRNAITRNFGGTITYTEPIGRRSLLEISSFYNTNSGQSDRKTYDYNSGSGKYDQYNTILSNDFTSSYNYGGGTVNFRSNMNKVILTVGSSFQSATLRSTNNTNSNVIEQRFSDLLPSANIQYRFTSSKTLSMNLNTSTTQPSTAQLQPIADVSDPLNTYTGNPNLKRSYVQSVNLSFFSTNVYTQRNLFAFVSATKTNNAIVNSDQIQPNGSRVSMPVNADGQYFVFGSVNAGFPIKKIKSRIDIGISTNYTRNIAFLNGARNNIANLGVGPSLNYSFAQDGLMDINASARLSISKATYSLQPMLNTNYLQQTYNVEMNNYLPLGLVMNNSFNYTVNSGRADGFNTKIPYWNASLAKGFMKNKRAELKLSVFDMLNKNIGINRSANQNYIEDTRYNVLQRYFLLSFTYRLNKAATGGGARIITRNF